MEAGDREATIAEELTSACDLNAISYTLFIVSKSFIVVLGQLCNILSEGEKLSSDSHRVSFSALMHEKTLCLNK